MWSKQASKRTSKQEKRTNMCQDQIRLWGGGLMEGMPRMVDIPSERWLTSSERERNFSWQSPHSHFSPLPSSGWLKRCDEEGRCWTSTAAGDDIARSGEGNVRE